MTVAELFQKVSLVPSGPVPWKSEVPESKRGIYVVARVDRPTADCESWDLFFLDPFPTVIKIDLEYERTRWLPTEAILYIGKTDRLLSTRLNEFYCHKCGHRRPHAGGQIIKLLRCNLWVYWSVAENPYSTEQSMIDIFKRQTGKVPYANYDRMRRQRRVHLSN